MKKMVTVFCTLVVLGAAQVGLAQYPDLLVPESSNDNVMLFSGFDGSLINASYIDMTPQEASTPVNAMVVGNEIWVTDQVSDNVRRYSFDGTTYLGEIVGGMDNIRGMEAYGNKAYVSNSGTGNGAPGDAVIVIDIPSQMITGNFVVGDNGAGDPFDVLAFDNNGEMNLLINDIIGEDIDVFGLDGTFMNIFHESDGVTGIDFPEQMNIRGSTGTVLAAGFSSPAGIYEYDMAGNQINYWDVGTGLRGVYELGNGQIMFTSGSGVFSFDPATGGVTELYGGVSGRYIEPIPEPGTLALLGLAGLALIRRR